MLVCCFVAFCLLANQVHSTHDVDHCLAILVSGVYDQEIVSSGASRATALQQSYCAFNDAYSYDQYEQDYAAHKETVDNSYKLARRGSVESLTDVYSRSASGTSYNHISKEGEHFGCKGEANLIFQSGGGSVNYDRTKETATSSNSWSDQSSNLSKKFLQRYGTDATGKYAHHLDKNEFSEEKKRITSLKQAMCTATSSQDMSSHTLQVIKSTINHKVHDSYQSCVEAASKGLTYIVKQASSSNIVVVELSNKSNDGRPPPTLFSAVIMGGTGQCTPKFNDDLPLQMLVGKVYAFSCMAQSTYVETCMSEPAQYPHAEIATDQGVVMVPVKVAPSTACSPETRLSVTTLCQDNEELKMRVANLEQSMLG